MLVIHWREAHTSGTPTRAAGETAAAARCPRACEDHCGVPAKGTEAARSRRKPRRGRLLSGLAGTISVTPSGLDPPRPAHGPLQRVDLAKTHAGNQLALRKIASAVDYPCDRKEHGASHRQCKNSAPSAEGPIVHLDLACRYERSRAALTRRCLLERRASGRQTLARPRRRQKQVVGASRRSARTVHVPH